MKIDIDPEKNRAQFEKLRRFSANNSVMFKPWFYYLFGFSFVAFGIVAVLAKEGSFKGNIGNLTQNEIGFIYLLIGVVIICICKVVKCLNSKISQYKPSQNRGDEW
jgi:hypothetical protein